MARIVVLLSCVLLYTIVTEAQDLTLDMIPQNLTDYQTNPLSVHIPYSVQLVCHNTPSAAVYNVNEMQYNNCTPPSTLSKYQIGHCANTPITLTISSISSPLVIDYQRGNTYYYALYGDNNDATYCQSGYKFKVYIVDPNAVTPATSSISPQATLTPSSDTFNTSPTVVVLSSTDSDKISTVSITAATTTASTSSIITTSTSITSQQFQTSSEVPVVTSRPTDVSQSPIIPGNIGTSLEMVAIPSAVGGGIFVIIVVIIILVLVFVVLLYYTRQRRKVHSQKMTRRLFSQEPLCSSPTSSDHCFEAIDTAIAVQAGDVVQEKTWHDTDHTIDKVTYVNVPHNNVNVYEL